MTKKEEAQSESKDQLKIDVTPEEIKDEIQVSINKLLKKREEAREKYKALKRTTFEALEDKGLMNPESLYEEHLKIEKKESKLSSNERTFVQQITVLSMQEVFGRKIKEAQEADEKLSKVIQKKKRTKKAKK